MKEKVAQIEQEAISKIENSKNLNEVNQIRTEYLGKKGPISELSSTLKELNPDEKKEFGMLLNGLKNSIQTCIDNKIKYYEQEELNKKLASEEVDITLPSTKIPTGAPSIVEKTVEELEEIFMSMGYDVVEGSEIELDKYNFELLNLPKGHPARDAQDTFYLEGEEVLLRSQTSPVQVRVMEEKDGKEPVRIICPGKTYRRDNDDATHSHQFIQMEGLLVDEHVSLSDLKGTFDVMAKKLFGNDVISRFRPSYYPFTEPSVEMDISCFSCKGKGCPLCKNTGWLTIGGGGIVHPQVLRNGHYDPKKWSGFAFGFGVERVAMLKYNINDLRTIYTTDLRETQVFDRREM